MDVCRFWRGVFLCGHDTSTDDSVPIYAMMCMPYIAVLALRVKRPTIFSVNMTSAPRSWPHRPSQHRFVGRCCGLLRLPPVPSGIDTRVVQTCWTYTLKDKSTKRHMHGIINHTKAGRRPQTNQCNAELMIHWTEPMCNM